MFENDLKIEMNGNHFENDPEIGIENANEIIVALLPAQQLSSPYPKQCSRKDH